MVRPIGPKRFAPLGAFFRLANFEIQLIGVMDLTADDFLI